MAEFTIDTLLETMRECAGESEAALAGPLDDMEFEQLGYDSLAVMETAARLKRKLSIELPEEELADVRTPGEFVRFVNERLAGLE